MHIVLNVKCSKNILSPTKLFAVTNENAADKMWEYITSSSETYLKFSHDLLAYFLSCVNKQYVMGFLYVTS